MAIPILDLGIDYGAVGGPAFKTDIVTSAAGFEKRRNYQAYPLGQWQLGERLVDEKTLEKLIAFYNGVKGPFQRFKYKDWGDYSADIPPFTPLEPAAYGYGEPIDASSFQLMKMYAALTDVTGKPLISTSKRIFHPSLVSAVIVDGVSIDTTTNPLVIDSETGVVTITGFTGITPTSKIHAAFEFYKPARFESPEFSATFENMEGDKRVYYISDLRVKEVIPY